MLSPSTIKAHALALGFDRCGIAPVGPFPELAFLDDWLRRGYSGTMSYPIFVTETAGEGVWRSLIVVSPSLSIDVVRFAM